MTVQHHHHIEIRNIRWNFSSLCDAVHRITPWFLPATAKFEASLVYCQFFFLSLVLRRLIFLASDVERGEKKQLSTVVAPAVIVMKNSLPIFFEFFIRFSSSVLYYTKG